MVLLLLCPLLSTSLAAQPLVDLVASEAIRVQAWDPQTAGVNNTRFGEAIAMDEDVLVVGAHLEDSAAGFDTGAVYVYERVGVDWVERQKLRSPFETPFERFGISVDVALGEEGEDYIIVGASGAGSGAAYLYKRTGGTGAWLQESTLDNLNPDSGDQFGRAVAIDYFLPPNTLDDLKVFVAAVGAPNDRDPVGGSGQEGSISIFQRSGGPPTWGITHEFFGENGDLLGGAVAMSGPDIVAGIEGLDEAFFNAGGAQVFSQQNFDGTVYVYAENWFLIPSDPEVGIGLGTVVAVDNRGPGPPTAVLGAPLDDTEANNAGKVLVFDLTLGGVGTTRIESATIFPDPVPGAFGTSVAISGDLLAVGAPGTGIDGTVFLYERGASTAEWNSVGSLTPPALGPPFLSCTGGDTVAAYGLTVAMGCPSGQLIDESVFIYTGSVMFFDGFETGNITEWSESLP